MCENLRNDKDDGPGDYNKSDEEEDDDAVPCFQQEIPTGLELCTFAPGLPC